MKHVAEIFGVSHNKSRVGVITFSNHAEHSIKLKDHDNVHDFNNAVDAIGLMGSVTRIDRALRTAQKEMFTVQNGARNGLAKVLVLLTDGSQTKRHDSEDPAMIAEELRNEGIALIVVGMGGGISHNELKKIAGSEDNVFIATSFNLLLSEKFIKVVRDKACKGKYRFIC